MTSRSDTELSRLFLEVPRVGGKTKLWKLTVDAVVSVFVALVILNSSGIGWSLLQYAQWLWSLKLPVVSILAFLHFSRSWQCNWPTCMVLPSSSMTLVFGIPNASGKLFWNAMFPATNWSWTKDNAPTPNVIASWLALSWLVTLSCEI